MTDNLVTEEPATEPEAPRRVRTPRKSLVALRIIAVVHLLVFFLQPVLAGIYLSGDFDAIGLHELNGQIVTIMAGSQLIGCLIYAWRGGGRWWPLWFSIGMVLLEETQKGLGYERVVAFHVPFGILLLATQLFFTHWTFSSRAKVARVPKARKKRRS
jgi:hypothetical protein